MTLLLVNPWYVYMILTACAFGSFISFIQIGSAASDKSRGLKTFWIIAGVVLGCVAVGLLIYVIKHSN